MQTVMPRAPALRTAVKNVTRLRCVLADIPKSDATLEHRLIVNVKHHVLLTEPFFGKPQA